MLYGLWERAQRHISYVPYPQVKLVDQISRPDVCGIRRQPMFHHWSTHLTSSFLSGERYALRCRTRGSSLRLFVNEAEVDSSSSFVPRHGSQVVQGSRAITRTYGCAWRRANDQALISHRAGRRAPHFHININPGVLDEAGPLIRQPVSGKENPSMPVYHSQVWVGGICSLTCGIGSSSPLAQPTMTIHTFRSSEATLRP